MSKPDKKLFLLDAYALIYRAHFAFSKNPRISSKGTNTGIMFGFTNTMLEVIQKQKPTHIGVAFDTPKPTFRHEQFKEYKAHREATPEDIKTSIPIVKDIIRGFNIPIIQMDGYEADDVVGTIAKDAARQGFEVFMMTPDKDYAQLVEENIYLYKPAYMGNAVDIMGVPEVLAKWDIERVDQVIDILGLHGDASDNIPGIPGVGAKTAVKFLKEYGSIEGLLENTDQLKGKQKEKVIEFAEQGLLSKQLATIETAVPIDYNLDDFALQEPNKDVLQPIFKELELRTLMQRVFGESWKAAAPKTVASDTQMSMFDNAAPDATKPEVVEILQEPEEASSIDTIVSRSHVVESKDDLLDLAKYLMVQQSICFGTVTTGSDPIEAKLLGLSFSYYDDESYYVPIPKGEDPSTWLEPVKAVFENEKIEKVGQNLKHDTLILRKLNIELKGEMFDTILAHYLIDPDASHGIEILAERYLNYQTIPEGNLIGGRNLPKSMEEVAPQQVAEFACESVNISRKLRHALDKELELANVRKLYTEVEEPLLRVLADMEYEGVRIDTNTLSEMSVDLRDESSRVQQEIFDLAGEEFNIASPKQLGTVLFEKMQLIDKPKKTKTGQYATGEEILSRLASEHEIASKILEFREYQKLKSTYVDALPDMISSFDNRIHTNYSQIVAATGRLSSINPNLQNIPIRTKKGREIRKAFIPRNEDFTLMSADYSQIELRIMAAFAEDESMLEAFHNGRDIHATTAAKIFKVPLDEVDGEMRGKAKSANFGIIYGISAFGLSQNLNIPRKEAVEIIESYFREFPAVKKYMDRVINEAKENEYVETILGRRRYLRDINSRNATMRGYSERNAINAPIQGSAADMIKVAMINIQKWMKSEGVKSRMIMQVHDELVFDVHNSEKDILKEKVENYMKEAVKLAVPMEVGIGFGGNWLEAH